MATITCKKTPVKASHAIEVVENPTTGQTNRLTYLKSRSGSHVVTLAVNPGEGQAQNFFWRFKTIEAARAQWRECRAEMAIRGYTRKVS